MVKSIVCACVLLCCCLQTGAAAGEPPVAPGLLESVASDVAARAVQREHLAAGGEDVGLTTAADRHPACAPGAGDCYSVNGSPGCEDVDCCETVCTLDAWCCDTTWDSFCVTKANDNCGSADPIGACCFGESCRDLTEANCTAAGGAFQGETPCTSSICNDGDTPLVYASTDAGTIYLGAIVNQDWGRPLAAGDFDNDGYDDVVVSASKSYGSVTSRVYLVRGAPDAHQRGVVDLSVGGVDQTIVGAQVDDNLGASVAVGDVNGDEIDDLLLCASSASYAGRTRAGVAYLIYGRESFFENPVRDLGVAGNWDVRIAGPIAGGDMGGSNAFGGLDTHAAAIGNLNGDAYGDIVLGVHLAQGAATQAGRVYVVFGEAFASPTTRDLLNSTHYDVVVLGDDEYDELGDFVLTGDITTDGIEELIIPNQYFSQYLFDSEGAVHIFRGRTTWSKTYNLGTASADITLLGAKDHDTLGESAVVGDFNSDGVMDLAASAPGADIGPYDDQQGDGFVYGLLGSSAYQTGTHTIHYASATPDFLIVGEHKEGLGAELAAGDFNGDGYDDIAAAERFGGPETNGVVEVLFGRDFTGSPIFTANVSTDVRIVGEAQDRIGFSLAASDVDGDGAKEVFFGTPFNNVWPSNTAGTVYVFAMLACDLDGDGDLDKDDFAVFLSAYGRSDGQPEYNAVCDLDDDGTVTIADYQLWLECYRKFIGDPEADPPVGLLGDFDFDEDIDLVDFAKFQDCMLVSEELEFPCIIKFDFNTDSEFDLLDFPGFAAAYTGP